MKLSLITSCYWIVFELRLRRALLTRMRAQRDEATSVVTARLMCPLSMRTLRVRLCMVRACCVPLSLSLSLSLELVRLLPKGGPEG